MERRAFAFGGDALVVEVEGSDVVVVPDDVEDVRVERQVEGWVFMGSGPEARWGLADGRLSLRVECGGVASNCGAAHRVRVPRAVAVSVEGDDGDVTVEGFATPLKVRSENGDVRVRSVSGTLDIGGDNGDVTVEASTTSPEVVARSENGDMRITLGAVPRRVDVAGDNGDLTIALPSAAYDVTGASENGDRRVDVPEGRDSGRTVSVRSENGDVVVRTAN
ncbi:DUF4097 family beta strand repeat-containing protein [Streptomyces sp. NPDC085460]|uniref:DUF4097 family beta strand repeat-containing protein n=1 Tax=Streptomyces sp. NPDC085460 TaxID=3365723 RepID=UPI0037D9687B